MKTLILVCSLLFYSLAHADTLMDCISIGWGQSGDNIATYRLEVQKNFNREFISSGMGRLTGRHEASLNYWEFEKEFIYALAWSPVFVAYIGDRFGQVAPYFEAGVGASYVSDTVISDHDLASHFQFEDRVGVGARVAGKIDIGLKLMHYSNAGLRQPNDGITLLILGFAYGF